MKINIYYGGRGLIEDSTLYVLSKIQEVLKELSVDVCRYNLYESKKEIATLSGTLKDADGVILAAHVEWFGIGGYLQQFLDSCWLYADKSKLSNIYMMPVVISSTYGEREAENTLVRAWELLGGRICPGITSFVNNQSEFETNTDYAKIIETATEDLYRTINRKSVRFPSSTAKILCDAVEQSSMRLTPEEGERLSKYVSDDSFVKKQKEDIEELSEIFTTMMGSGEAGQEFIRNFKDNFIPPTDGTRVVFLIKMTDTKKDLVVDVTRERLKVYYGEYEKPDVIATTTRSVVERIVNGRQTFQGAFMQGDIATKGDFKIMRLFDTFFRFNKI
ncbi:MAG: SCP2 sterol-binding domain-containing protein [Lachnospiraceae bacterium]|nr:SCP2 sterol-binding domain-containing protein [Lachnospiraceae bacterium]